MAKFEGANVVTYVHLNRNALRSVGTYTRDGGTKLLQRRRGDCVQKAGDEESKQCCNCYYSITSTVSVSIYH